MHITGVICEYNPLHSGHEKQLTSIRSQFGQDSGIVCLMSGNFVQRGHPAITDKSLRAKAALLCGADLVLELPITASLSSAEGFAARGVEILSDFCDCLCFGAETNDKKLLMQTAAALLQPEFPQKLRLQLDKGLSFPAARQKTLEVMGIPGAFLALPNNILAIEYCKAILSQQSSMEPFPILREGGYHDTVPDPENPSATAIRNLMLQSDLWLDYIPEKTRDCFRDAPLHTIGSGEQAILYRLRTMTDDDYEALPYGSEGLWRKLMHAGRSCATLQEVVDAVKSKRYTRSRIDRMILCAFLGITEKELHTPAPYVRVLALNDKGRQILRKAREHGSFLNPGEHTDDPYESLEVRVQDLYGLFCTDGPERPGTEKNRRIVYEAI